MIFDTRKLTGITELEADVCIVGGGAAGITIAQALIGGPLQVCLLESGGLEFDPDIQRLHQGDVLDKFFFDLELSRIRMFGGTTNHWSGTSRPLDELTFAPRPGIPYSGWPISRSDLEAYYEPAHRLCQLQGSYEYGNDYWGVVTLPATIKRLTSVIYQRNYPVRFNEVFHDSLNNSENVNVFLYGTALEIVTDETGQTVHKIRVGRLNGEDLAVSARIFVLAMGSVENARILLLSNDAQDTGLGNTYDLVGRFLSDHPAIGVAAELLPTDLYLDRKFFFEVRPARLEEAKLAQLRPRLMLSPEIIMQEQLNQYLFDFSPQFAPSVGVESIKTIVDQLENGDLPDDLFEHLGNVLSDLDDVIDAGYKTLFDKKVGIFNDPEPLSRMIIALEMEQSPNPDSRVTLSDQTDAFGQRKVAVDWRMNSTDLDRAKRAMELLAAELGAAGIGRIRSILHIPHESVDKWPDAAYPDGLYVGYHQMGTTRMSNDPHHGVVDLNCRVHGVSNLFIAGSSVFPTVGHERPTLNIVALALRLTDHIKKTLEAGP